MLFAVIVAVLLIALIVFLVFAAKNWHWLHLTAIVLVFLTAVPSLYCAAFVLKTRKALVKLSADSIKEAATQELAYNDLLSGAEPGPSGEFGKGSLKGAVTELKLLTLGKGRAWDNATVSASNGVEITLNIPAPQAAAADPAAPVDPAAAAPAGDVDLTGSYPTPTSLVYLFQASSWKIENGSQVTVPGAYLGAVRVGQVNGSQVVTSAEVLVSQGIRNGDAVVIYEKPPTDFHGIMHIAMGFDENSTPTIDEVRAKFLEMFPAESFGLNVGDGAFVKMVNNVSFDRRPVTEIDQWLNAQGLPSLEPSPLEVMNKVRLLEDISVEVDGTQDMVTNGAFDALGRTNDPDLQIGKEAKVSKGRAGDDKDVMILDERTAALGYLRPDGVPVKSMEEEGRAEVISRIYYRQLHDYTSEIEQKMLDVTLLEERIKEYQVYNSTTDKIYADANAQVAVRDTKISQLSQDQENLKKDLATIDSYSQKLEGRLGQLKKQIRESYLQIGFIHQKKIDSAKDWAASGETVSTE